MININLICSCINTLLLMLILICIIIKPTHQQPIQQPIQEQPKPNTLDLDKLYNKIRENKKDIYDYINAELAKKHK